MRPTPIRRVVLLVLDGLRPDAIPRFGLHHTAALARNGASTMLGRTVTPSVTACAMASLLTGATPQRHGLQDMRFRIPRPSGPLHPLPRLLAQHAFPSSAFLARVPMLLSGVAQRIATHVGVSQARFSGSTANDILTAATATIETQKRGLILLHWPDGDRAGHARGWMSEGYEAAARAMDVEVGRLVRMLDLTDPSTLLIALADHGGGGAVIDHHDSTHPLDQTIPIILAGGAVRRGDLARGTSLLDVPATVAEALGIPLPSSFAGTPIRSCFATDDTMVAA
ncbi:MAG: alkaline phosphatase family protein [Gemmatimonadaceae bacterium]|nr:alkaline phosphatase family protein [Gemmatimonadaceae bacterium]